MITITNRFGYNILDTSTFSGGEEHVLVFDPEYSDILLVKADIRSSKSVIQLLMAVDAVRRVKPYVILNLLMPYIPYARQDRVCNEGEALSIKVFADLINSCNFHSVEVWDAHSDVSVALIDRCRNVSQDVLFDDVFKNTDATLVSPDAGANKKVQKLSTQYQLPMIRADKTRDLKTGAITGTEVYCDNLEGNSVTIVDDICDGGRTFVELAKVLKKKNAGTITLVVTHAILPSGTTTLFDAGITEIVTVNPWEDWGNKILGTNDLVIIRREDAV